MSNRKKQVIGIVVAWTLVGLVITLYDHLAYQEIVSNGVNTEYSIYKSLCINVLVGILAALAGGSFLVYYINERYMGSLIFKYWAGEKYPDQ